MSKMWDTLSSVRLKLKRKNYIYFVGRRSITDSLGGMGYYPTLQILSY